MELIVDASATLINRTAVNFLIRDTVEALGHDIEEFQFFGERSPGFQVTETLRTRLLQKFHSVVGSARVPAPESTGAKRAPILYFDPLYTLFGDLQEQDFVFVLDMTTITNPEWHSPNVSRLYEAAFARILESRCSTIHISRNTMLAMRAALGSEGTNAHVLHLYVRKLSRPSESISYYPFSLVNKYFLFVGSLETRKNIAGLIYAYHMADLCQQGVRLVIAGGDGHGAEEIREAAEHTAGVALLGYVSDADLHRLYQEARAFVYPSFLEGFGVPLLEAMAYGLPCLAATTGAAPEVGGTDMIYVDPCDPPAISRALITLARQTEDHRKQHGERLQKRALQLFGFETYMRSLRLILAGGN